MANPINGHIDFQERSDWNQTTSDLNTHTSNSAIHVPTPPSDSSTKNYYLGSDLQWHIVPSAVIN